MSESAQKYDSNEELWIAYYLDELKANSLIVDWKYQYKTYSLCDGLKYEWCQKLKTKTKNKTSSLIQGHEYTPDFFIEWNESARNHFFNTLDDKVNLKDSPFIAHSFNLLSIIDVKPSFDMQNMTRIFTINQKWMIEKYGLYVQKIIPVKEHKHYHKIGNGKREKKVYSHSTWTGLFPKTFTPERFFFTDVSMKERKIRFPVKTLQEYLNGSTTTQ